MAAEGLMFVLYGKAALGISCRIWGLSQEAKALKGLTIMVDIAQKTASGQHQKNRRRTEGQGMAEAIHGIRFITNGKHISR